MLRRLRAHRPGTVRGGDLPADGEGRGGTPQAAPEETAPAPVPPAARATVEITAPMVGVAYAAPTPDAQPYIQLGQRVEKGQTLCLMEAMKMMNEIPAPCAGTVAAIRFQNGQLAEFGAVLVELEETGC